MVAWSSLLFSVGAAASALASPTLQARVSPGSVITKCTKPGTVALTFDDGPYKYNTDLVATLNKAGVKGTFFLNGQNYDNIYNYRDQIVAAKNAGHQIASHTWSHADLTSLHGDALKAEFSKLNDALKDIIGVTPAFMRPPYGNHNAEVDGVAKQFGQAVVIWDFDSGDSVGASVEDSEADYENVAKEHPSTLLALNHEVYDTTVYDVIPNAITTLKNAGYTQFVTVAECVGGSAYY